MAITSREGRHTVALMNRATSSLALAGLAVLALAGCGSTGSTLARQSAAPATSSATTGTSAEPAISDSPSSSLRDSGDCAGSELHVDLSLTTLQEARGLLTFTNEGADTCTLKGWPVVVLTGPSGNAITRAYPGTEIAETSVNVAPHGHAYAYLAFTSSHRADGSSIGCRSTTSADYKFRVTPPGEGQMATVIPNPDLYLCIDNKQSLVVWRVMPKLDPLSIG